MSLVVIFLRLFLLFLPVADIRNSTRQIDEVLSSVVTSPSASSPRLVLHPAATVTREGPRQDEMMEGGDQPGGRKVETGETKAWTQKKGGVKRKGKDEMEEWSVRGARME